MSPKVKTTIQTAPQIKLRGLAAMLPHGGLPESVSPYLIALIKKTGGVHGPIGKQFIAQPELESRVTKKGFDPLNEDHNEVAPGLVYKYRGKINKKGEIEYYGRCLWTVTRLCATYCRFCTRGREVGMPPHVKSKTNAAISHKFFLSDEEIEQVFKFLKKHKEINEVILSGGDPLTAPQPYLTKIITGLSELQSKGFIDTLRIGTRLPVHNPLAVQDWHYQLLAKIRHPYVMLHVNHPYELTDQTKSVIANLRKISAATVFGQSVFLKGVNDSVETLYQLFTSEIKAGVIPYYLLQNDAVYWARHFTVPMKRAIKIWEKLRPKLSGIAATAKFVIDVPYGYGKIPLPEGGAWVYDSSHFYDFKHKKHPLNYAKNVNP
ncbi:MAG: radical SAM protein [Patescibacteria group bacterium]